MRQSPISIEASIPVAKAASRACLDAYSSAWQPRSPRSSPKT